MSRCVASRVIWLPLIVVAVGCRQPERRPSALIDLLPARQIPGLGLMAAHEPVEYQGERLQAYIGHGAEIPMTFGFRSLATIRYRDVVDARNTVIIEVYELGGPVDAVAVLRLLHRREAPTALGAEGRQDPNTIAFAQGRYYVVTRAVVMRRERWQGLRDLAASIALRIVPDREGLDQLDLLPSDAVRGTVFFVRTRELLEQLATLPAGGFVFHSADTVALAAERADGEGRLALVHYPDAKTAKTAADLARESIGMAWSRWAITQRGPYVLTFVRHTGHVGREDFDRCHALLKRLVPEE